MEPNNPLFPDTQPQGNNPLQNDNPTDTTQQTPPPQQTQTPPPDTAKPADKPADSKTIKFSDFESLLGKSDTPISTPRKEEEKIDDTQEDRLQTKPDKGKEPEQQDKQPVPDKGKEPAKQTPEVPETEAQKEEDAKEVANEIRTSKKDFTDIPEEHKRFFDKMGLRSFDFIKPIYLEHKKQKELLEQKEAELVRLRSGALPESYLEHPRAYTLTPEFEKAADQYSAATDIVNHWKQQLARVRSGEETYQELTMDNGRFYLTKPIVATKETEAELMSILENSEAQLARVRARVESVGATHAIKAKEAAAHLTEFENKAFVPLAGEKNEPLVKDTIKNVLHPAYHNNPLARVFVKSLLVLNMLGEEVKKLKAASTASGGQTTTNGTGNTNNKVTTDDKKKAGPIASNMGAGGSGGSPAPKVSIKDFEEVMGRR